MSFTGKSAIVTGGGSGMGEAISKRLAQEGASVLIADVDEVGGARVVAEIVADGGAAVFHRTDISDLASAQSMVDAAVAAFGKVDLAANVAGVAQPPALIQDTTDETWNRVFGVNTTGLFHSLRAEIPALLAAGGGAVVNIASTTGLSTAEQLSAYSSSKHAAIGLTRNVALENARTGIRVNGIAPGIIQTPLLTRHADEATLAQYAESVPSGRLSTPEEIAAAVLFLLSDDASYITGAILTVDGGQLLA